MKFQFEDLHAFLTMGGHGVNVWASYILVYTILIYLTAAPLLNKKTFLKQQKKLLQLQKKSQDNSQ